MSHERQQRGVAGERAAERCVRRHGYTIVERNYRCPLGEVDLIALDGRTVVFIEVRTRVGAAVDLALDSVGARKQRQITRAAEHYLAVQRLENRAVRFDVVGVWQDGDELVCELLQDAFGPDDGGGW